MVTLGKSKLTSGRPYNGIPPEEVWHVLETAYSAPIFIASNYAREMSTEVSFAASMGWLSTLTLNGQHYTRRWHVTREGITALETRGF